MAPRDDDPERETSAFTPQKLKLLRETLSPPRPEKRGSACGRPARPCLVPLARGGVFGAPPRASTRFAWWRRFPRG